MRRASRACSIVLPAVVSSSAAALRFSTAWRTCSSIDCRSCASTTLSCSSRSSASLIFAAVTPPSKSGNVAARPMLHPSPRLLVPMPSAESEPVNPTTGLVPALASSIAATAASTFAWGSPSSGPCGRSLRGHGDAVPRAPQPLAGNGQVNLRLDLVEARRGAGPDAGLGNAQRLFGLGHGLLRHLQPGLGNQNLEVGEVGLQGDLLLRAPPRPLCAPYPGQVFCERLL